jgi:probable phosphoglycerate mutase
LRGAGVVRAYASDLSRARETAEIVAAALKLASPVALDARLRERGYGCFEGLTREECETRHPEVWQRYLADRRLVPPDAEPQAAIVARATAALREIATAPYAAGEPVDPVALVICHGGTIRTFVQAELGLLLPPLANGRVLRLRFDDNRFVSVDHMTE